MRQLLLSLAVIVSLPVAAYASGAAGQGAADRLQVETSLQPASTSYKVSLLSGSTERFLSAEGTYTDKSALSCEGWNIEQRLTVKFIPPAQHPARPVIPVYMRSGSNTFESSDGLVYRFEDKTSMEGQLISSHKGEARLSAIGGPGTASFDDPADKTMDLPAGTIFPVGYTARLMAAAGQGLPSYEAIVFDGSMSAEIGLLRINTVIGYPRAATFKQHRVSTVNPGDVDFTTQLAWPLRLRIFRADAEGGARHLFEQGFTMLPYGRAETMVMDFGQFKLRFDLDKYEELPAPDCP